MPWQGAESGAYVNTHELVRGMPTAMCHICHKRIPLDEIDEHAEWCESQIAKGYDPGSLGGSTTSIKVRRRNE